MLLQCTGRDPGDLGCQERGAFVTRVHDLGQFIPHLWFQAGKTKHRVGRTDYAVLYGHSRCARGATMSKSTCRESNESDIRGGQRIETDEEYGDVRDQVL